jgi:hypothetical protein
MRLEIERLSAGSPRRLERDIQDAEIEARTLARVVLVADRLVAGLEVDDPAADGVRALVAEFYSSEDLPVRLRAPAAQQSRTRLAGGTLSCLEVGRERGT